MTSFWSIILAEIHHNASVRVSYGKFAVNSKFDLLLTYAVVAL